jgi:hypothetical protein
MKNKKLAEYRDYDANDLTSTGGDWTLYADGRVGMTTRTRWQGSMDGARYIARDAVDVSTLADGEAEASLISFAHEARSRYEVLPMDLIRSGRLVQ